MAAKKPSFQFYSADWLKDPAVRSVSLAARGLWTDMLCLMDQSSRRGYLQHATGKPVTAEQLARMTGCSTDEASRLLQELADSGVYSFTDNSVIFSRRMVRDERKRELCAQAGRLGGNPTLKGGSKGDAKGGVKGVSKRNPTPSSSTSSSDTPNGVSGDDSSRQIPPDIEAVKAYCLERGKGVNPNKWFAFYESKGWMIGKNKMKDWRAAVRNWEDDDGANGQANQHQRGPGTHQGPQPSSRVAVPAGALDKFDIRPASAAGSAGGNLFGASEAGAAGGHS